jgi:hypothetical protein
MKVILGVQKNTKGRKRYLISSRITSNQSKTTTTNTKKTTKRERIRNYLDYTHPSHQPAEELSLTLLSLKNLYGFLFNGDIRKRLLINFIRNLNLNNMPISDLINKDKYVNQKEYKQRLDLCYTCPERQRANLNAGRSIKISKTDRCPETCRCIILEKAKLRTEHCDLGDW